MIKFLVFPKADQIGLSFFYVLLRICCEFFELKAIVENFPTPHIIHLVSKFNINIENSGPSPLSLANCMTF